MRRWLRILVVGTLTVVLAIDSASACRFLRRRCRPRCRVVTCRTVEVVSAVPVVIDECISMQCCVPADGSAHVVIDESWSVDAPVTAQPAPAAAHPAPAAVAPKPIEAPVPALEPVAPVSAEKPLPAEPPVVPTPPAPEPQFKSAAEILAESAEKERLAKEAAAKAATPTPEPQFKTAAEILAESAEKPMAKERERPEEPEQSEEPAEPAPKKPEDKKPEDKKPEDNLFDDEGEDVPAGEGGERTERQPMKKQQEPAENAPDNLFDEPEAPAEKAPAEEPAKAEDDPFASILEPPAEPVRRWIDDTGRHETIGRLVEIRPDSVRILKDNGRHATVPLGRLSQHDLTYVTATGERLAAQKAAAPAVTDTARR